MINMNSKTDRSSSANLNRDTVPMESIMQKKYSRTFGSMVVEYWMTRFGTLECFVVDTEREDEIGLPLVVFQCDAADDARALEIARA